VGSRGILAESPVRHFGSIAIRAFVPFAGKIFWENPGEMDHGSEKFSQEGSATKEKFLEE